jgi:hypothetical protein
MEIENRMHFKWIYFLLQEILSINTRNDAISRVI